MFSLQGNKKDYCALRRTKIVVRRSWPVDRKKIYSTMKKTTAGKRSRVGFWWHFDRVFGDNKRIVHQVLYLLVAMASVVLFIALVGMLLPKSDHSGEPGAFIQAIGLVFGATDLPSEPPTNFPTFWQVLASLLGAVMFGGVTITFVGNLLGNRQEAYRNGSVRYWFDDHLLFLGGGEMVVPMLKKICADAELRERHIVVLTERDAAEVRLELIGQLSDAERTMKITILRGRRDDADELRSVGCERAACLYIVGDDPADEDYDSVNMACWNEARRQCDGRNRVPCYLLLERASSEYIFRHNDQPLPTCFDTTVMNRLEAVAQRVLVHNSDADDRCPALDRGGIAPDSDRTVHLVLYGMTAFSYAMATTAAHLCHFPNFVSVGGSEGKRVYGERLDRRTRITFIAPNIAEEMNYMTAHLSSLFAMSKVTVDGVTTTPDEDFLDIEWEFVDGNIADPAIRQKLEQYYRDNEEGRTYLTLALCQREARHNIASALYLPECFHRIVEKDGEVDFEKTIPIFAYQPDSEEQLRMAHDEVPLYRNIFPVGSVRESYDPAIRRRISEGKRINYIYQHHDDYRSMPLTEESFDKVWPKSYAEQKSNIYCANQIGVKLRSIGGDGELLRRDEALCNLMAVVEHNRWNMEKLLMGFGPVDKAEREALKQLERDGNTKAVQEKKTALKQLRKQFKHNCIAPYSQLLAGDQSYDTVIIKNLVDVIEK